MYPAQPEHEVTAIQTDYACDSCGAAKWRAIEKILAPAEES